MDLSSVASRAPRSTGLTTDELGSIETVYRHDLLRGRHFLVSGGGSGMGRATAFLIARLGADVTICGRDEGKLQATASEIKRLLDRDVHFQAMTIRNPAQVHALISEIFDRNGPLDGLVNSAGGQFPQEAIDYSVGGWNAVIDTNLNGTWWMMQSAARHWRDRGQPGSIVNIVATFDRGIPQAAHTAAARAGVVYLSKSVAVEWAPLQIRVNCIAPGNTLTEGVDRYPPEYAQRFAGGNPMRQAGDTWDLAQAVVYLCASSGKWITGALLHVNGGMHLWGTNWPLGMPDHFKDQAI